MSESKRVPKQLKPKRVRYINALLQCLTKFCRQKWNVVDLNPERKTVLCPTCGRENDIKEAIKNANPAHVAHA